MIEHFLWMKVYDKFYIFNYPSNLSSHDAYYLCREKLQVEDKATTPWGELDFNLGDKQIAKINWRVQPSIS